VQTLVQVSGHARRPRVLLQVCRKPMNYFSYRSLKRPLFHLRSYAAGNVSVSRSPVPSVVAPSLKYAETLAHNEVVTSQSDCFIRATRLQSRDSQCYPFFAVSRVEHVCYILCWDPKSNF